MIDTQDNGSASAATPETNGNPGGAGASGAPAATPAGVTGTPAGGPPVIAPSAPSTGAGRNPWQRRELWAVVALFAIVIVQWFEMRERMGDLHGDLASRLAQSDAQSKENQTLVRQHQESLSALQAKVGGLEARLAEAQSQQLALESMYQELSRTRDERLLAEVEQTVTLAAQQLQLAGNVEAALIALQGADARLARSAQPQFLPVRKLIARDMDKLKSLPTADISGIAVRLETVIGEIDNLPLAFTQRPAASASAPARKSTEGNVVLRFFEELWSDVRGLIRIERVESGGDPALLSPSQTFFLRENLKLRLVNARLALLSRDARGFRDDLRQSRAWLEKYFDSRAKPVQAVLVTVSSLAATDVAVEPPSLNETLAALRNIKLVRTPEALSGPAGTVKAAPARPAQGAR